MNTYRVCGAVGRGMAAIAIISLAACGQASTANHGTAPSPTSRQVALSSTTTEQTAPDKQQADGSDIVISGALTGQVRARGTCGEHPGLSSWSALFDAAITDKPGHAELDDALMLQVSMNPYKGPGEFKAVRAPVLLTDMMGTSWSSDDVTTGAGQVVLDASGTSGSLDVRLVNDEDQSELHVVGSWKCDAP